MRHPFARVWRFLRRYGPAWVIFFCFAVVLLELHTVIGAGILALAIVLALDYFGFLPE